MVAQADYPRDPNDDDFMRQFADAANKIVDQIYADWREEGREDAALRLLSRQLQLRPGRTLSPEETHSLERRIASMGMETLAEQLLTASQEDLEGWFSEPATPR